MIDFRRLLSRAPAWALPVVLILALIVGTFRGLGPALLTVAGSALLGAVTLIWLSLGALTGDSPLTLDEAIGLGAPSPEEERKRSILRALKDLEYERTVGKISEEDFAELSQRYRREAKDLLRALDEELGPRRQAAEEILRERLKKEGLGPTRKGRRKSGDDAGATETAGDKLEPTQENSANGGSVKEEPAAKGGAPATPPSVNGDRARVVCRACETPNDSDALFCKRCGGALGAEAS